MSNTEREALGAYRSRFTDLKAKYVNLEDRYCTLSVPTRRDLRQPFAMEIFIVAAILQHRPQSQNFWFTVFRNGEHKLNEIGNELCPVWTAWFREMQDLDRLFTSTDILGVIGEQSIVKAQTLLHKAEWKFYDVEQAFSRITTTSTPSLPPISHMEILHMWNGVCEWIASGQSVQGAIWWITMGMPIREPYWQDGISNGYRSWFLYEPSVEHVSGYWWHEVQALPQHSAAQIRYHLHESRPQASPPRPETWQTQPQTATEVSPIYDMNKASSTPQEALTEYNILWEKLSPYERNFPLPSVDFSIQALQSKETVTYAPNQVSGWVPEMVMRANTFIFFVHGAGLTPIITEDRAKVSLRFTHTPLDRASIQALLRHLKLKELFKYHPDKLNARTGKPGTIDEQLGNDATVVAIRSAIQDLIDVCEEALR